MSKGHCLSELVQTQTLGFTFRALFKQGYVPCKYDLNVLGKFLSVKLVFYESIQCDILPVSFLVNNLKNFMLISLMFFISLLVYTEITFRR